MIGLWVCDYTSQTRNKLIAKAFKEIGLIERYGSGIKRIINICKEHGSVEPVFEECGDGFSVILYKNKIEKEIFNLNVIEKSSEFLIKMIAQNPEITIYELAKMRGISTRAIEKQLAKLKDQGIFRRIGLDNGGRWEVLNKL